MQSLVASNSVSAPGQTTSWLQ